MRLVNVAVLGLALTLVRCGALLDREDRAEPSPPGAWLQAPVVEQEFEPQGAGPGGCVESGRTLWGPEPDILSLTMARIDARLYLSFRSPARPAPPLLHSDVGSELPPLEPLPWDDSGLSPLGAALVPAAFPVPNFPAEGWAAIGSEAGVYWLTKAEDDSASTLWLQEESERGAEPVATLGFSARELYAEGSTVWVGGGEHASVYDGNTGAVRELAVVPDGGFVGFSGEGPVFQRRLVNRQGGVPYRYELWLSSPTGEEPARLWAAPIGTTPTQVWATEGLTFATGYTFFGGGPSRAVIVRLQGGAAQTLVCLPAELQFGTALPIAFRQAVAAIVAPASDVQNQQLVLFSLR